jgi:beta-lactamase class C
MTRRILASLSVVLLAACRLADARGVATEEAQVKSIADEVVDPVMKQFAIPGMAVGISVNGKHYILNYGIASKTTQEPVTDRTLFEIGSVSKTFTATLASLAEAGGYLSLTDKAGKYLLPLQDTKAGEVDLVELGTHTAGGFPLQLPAGINDDGQLMTYFQHWQPSYKPGTYRTYANPSVGLLGLVAAQSMHGDFATLLQEKVFSPLGMKNSYAIVPDAEMKRYAMGYTKQDKPVRMESNPLAVETYGIKTNANDLVRFIDANIGAMVLNDGMRRAIMGTHTGYFKAGPMVQDLIWEQYDYPTDMHKVLEGSSDHIVYDPVPVTRIMPPMQPRKDVLLEKAGSTNGFGAYIAFIPEKDIGVAILANKNYPVEERIKIAGRIFSSLGY